ncbi:MAG: ABC transporter permease subunit [Lachnospiraceae bacterium]|nr:ABC transporter permease subunit [Lachnospiraceae bacterium]
MPVNRWKNLYFRRLVFCSLLLTVIIIIALAAPFIAPNDAYKVNMADAFAGPCRQYPLGTDDLGRCILSRILCGARTTIFSSLSVVAVVAVIGTAIGITAGYMGGIVDEVLLKITLVFQAFPNFILAVAVAGILGSGLRNCMMSIVAVYWTKYARLSRSLTLGLAEEDYVKAARVCGAGEFQIMLRHIMPNMIAPLITTAALDISGVILYMAGLSFLGLGAEKPSSEWGLMMNEARAYLQLHPRLLFLPGIALLICVTLFNLFGDCIRDYMDHPYGNQPSEE